MHRDGFRILLAEDGVVLAELMAEILREAGYCVVGPVATTVEAMQYISSIDAAILDIELEDGDSYRIIDKLRESSIPVGLTTGYVATTLHAKYQSLPILSKPFGTDDLRAFARRLIMDRAQQPQAMLS